MPKSFTWEEIALHNNAESLWVVVDRKVYDVTAFRSMHPGGEELLLSHAGRDATAAANAGHAGSRKAMSLMSKYFVGHVALEVPKMKVVSLEDMANGYEKPEMVALERLGEVEPKKTVALEDLGKEEVKKSNNVALEDLGRAGDVSLEDLGQVKQTLAVPSRGTRTGRTRKEEKEEEEQPTQVEEEEEEEVDPEEDQRRAHVRILLSSWAVANKQEESTLTLPQEVDAGHESESSEEPVKSSKEMPRRSRFRKLTLPKMNLRSIEWNKLGSTEKLKEKDKEKEKDEKEKEKEKEKGRTIANDEDTPEKEESVQALLGTKVPATYSEMFEFNATVMGFGKHKWLAEVNRSFDDIVKNSGSMARLKEESQVLALRICHTAEGEVSLSMYKSAMLAALRSMLPKTWDPEHENAWNWLWECVDGNLREILYKPRVWQPELLRLMSRFSEKEKEAMRDEVYNRFFQVAPAGQEYFKQSNTRLHFIATRAMDMTSELFHDPWEMTEQISALGLRHVGYGIPTQLIEPFAQSFVEVLREQAPEEQTALEGFEWSLQLVAKILIRVIQEGSTIVMKAINVNSALQLRRAVALAPRGERAQWLLCIQVGTQKISPLNWAIESGSLEAARAIIQDLLTIRADRDRYYYGVDALFQTHPDIVEVLCQKAQLLLGTLLDGLVWRSKRTMNAARRVNFYVKHLVVRDGKFAGALNAICVAKDVKIISNQVLVLLSDTLWTGVVRRQFILSKVSFIFSLLIFMLSEAVLPKIANADQLNIRIAVFAGRVINYAFSMLRLLIFHGKRIYKAYRTGAVTKGRCPLPLYLKDEDARMGLMLLVLLMAMCAGEPMFYCAYTIPETGPTERCDAAEQVMQLYIILAVAAMILHWLLVINLSVFATKLAAFVLVIREVLSEVGKFMVAIVFILVTFSSAIASLRHDVMEFSTLPKAANCLFATTVGIYEGDYREMLHQPALLCAVFMFITVSAILLINLLIAQLNCSYDYVYGDMLGFARLDRASLIVDAMVACPPARFTKFVSSLRFDQLLEFDEGDVGLGGGIQVKEQANLVPTSEDIIQRYGGTSSPEMQWPKEESESDRFTRIKNLITQLTKKEKPIKGSGSNMGVSRDDTGEDSTGSSH